MNISWHPHSRAFTVLSLHQALLNSFSQLTCLLSSSQTLIRALHESATRSRLTKQDREQLQSRVRREALCTLRVFNALMHGHHQAKLLVASSGLAELAVSLWPVISVRWVSSHCRFERERNRQITSMGWQMTSVTRICVDGWSVSPRKRLLQEAGYSVNASLLEDLLRGSHSQFTSCLILTD